MAGVTHAVLQPSRLVVTHGTKIEQQLRLLGELGDLAQLRRPAVAATTKWRQRPRAELAFAGAALDEEC